MYVSNDEIILWYSGQDEAIGETRGQDEAIGELHVQDEAIGEPHYEKLLDDSYYCKDNEESKLNGVLAAATCIDGNNSLFPLAYSVLESENAESWTWFLENLRKAIGIPNGLVISSDMQKGLEIAIMQIYPNGAAKTYYVSEHDLLLKEIADVCKEAITYVHQNHNKVWSKTAFIAFIRDANWDKYVDLCYTIKKFKEAYALEIAPILDRDEWIDIQPGEKIYPPIIKRLAGRPRKNRIIAADEHPKKNTSVQNVVGL
ncbi:transposase, MuDR, MULE transposase domain protein [Tanacetum coccineum]